MERGNYVQENTVISDNHLRIGHVGHGVVDWHTDFFFFPIHSSVGLCWVLVAACGIQFPDW